MKKRILSFMLVLAMSFSLGAVFTFAADDTGPITGMTASELKTQIQAFVQTANPLIKRDDWEKIPGASKSPATTTLENQIEQAKAVHKSGNVAEMESFLIDLFGGWDAEAKDFVYGDKPYSEFKEAIMLKGLDDETARGEKGYWDLLPIIGEVEVTKKDEDGNEIKEIVQLRDYTNPGQYTAESWDNFREQLDFLNVYLTVVDGVMPYMNATRSEVYFILQDYYAAYDALELLPSGQDPEVNRLNSLLKEVLDFEDRKGYPVQKWFDGVTINTDSVEMQAFKDWIAAAEQLVDNPDATAEQLKQYVYTGTLIRDPNDDNVLIETPEGQIGLYGGAYTFYYEKMQTAFELSVLLDNGYRAARSEIYYEALSDYESGRYKKEDWDVFLKAFEPGDKLLNTSWITNQKTEDQFLSALQTVQTAYYDVLLPTRVNDAQHELIYKNAKALYDGLKEKDELDLYVPDTVVALENALNEYELVLDQLNEYKASGNVDNTVLTKMVERANQKAVNIQNAVAGLKLLQDENAAGTTEILTFAKGVLADAKQCLVNLEEDGGRFGYSIDEMYFADTINAYNVEIKNLEKQINTLEKEIAEGKTEYSVTNAQLLESVTAVYSAMVDLHLNFDSVIYEEDIEE